MPLRSTNKINGKPTIKTTEQQRLFGLEEAPTFYPTKEEFEDPLVYIEKISNEGSKYGIVKIAPPSDYNPEFFLNTEEFRFKTRVQKLNPIDSCNNVNYLHLLSKYHNQKEEKDAKVPKLNTKWIDIYKLRNQVALCGGFQVVDNQRKWVDIGRELGYAGKNSVSLCSLLKTIYCELILPFEVWRALHKGKDAHDKEDCTFSVSSDDSEACEFCSKTQDGVNMLLCDGCNSAYHIYCLTPPLRGVPKRNWYCPQCLQAVLDNPDVEDGPEYTLLDFERKSDKFKKDWFRSKTKTKEKDCEAEFWRLVNNPDETCEVEYGSNLHSTQHGSGFKTFESLSQDAFDPWSLNVIPVSERSLFTYVRSENTRLMMPWLHVGMCFSSHCWYNEDHYTYSINYMHWGDPRTCYGVPKSDIYLFEASMRKDLSELLDNQPDLLIQPISMISPEQLTKDNVKVYAVDQQPGQFVVTFPKAYHAGFNHGFNFCESVNFAPISWIDDGLECVKRYRDFRRAPCFSHDELLVTIVQSMTPDSFLDTTWLIRGLTEMQQREMADRKLVRSRKTREFVVPEDDSRTNLQCDFCHCYTYLSFTACACADRVSCAEHVPDLCNCSNFSKTLYIRVTDDQLNELIQKVQDNEYTPDKWIEKLSATIASNPTLEVLRNMLEEGDRIGVPEENLGDLQDFIVAIDRWLTRAGNVLYSNWKPDKDEFKDRIGYIQSLLEDAKAIEYNFSCISLLQEYLTKLLEYDTTITDELIEYGDEEAQQRVYDQGALIFADSKRFVDLKNALQSRVWSAEVKEFLKGTYNADTAKRLIEEASKIGAAQGPWMAHLTVIDASAKKSIQYIEDLCSGRKKIDYSDKERVFSMGKNADTPYLSYTLDPQLFIRLEEAMMHSRGILDQAEEMLKEVCSRPDVTERPLAAAGHKLMGYCMEVVFKSEITQRLISGLVDSDLWDKRALSLFDPKRSKTLEIALDDVLTSTENIVLNGIKLDRYCFCRRPEGRLMISCRACNQRFHRSCTRMTQFVNHVSYICPICDFRGQSGSGVALKPLYRKLKELMDDTKPLLFCPNDYSTIQDIYTRIMEFKEQIRRFCTSREAMRNVEEIKRYLFCLEGLHFQLPEERASLQEKLEIASVQSAISLLKHQPSYQNGFLKDKNIEPQRVALEGTKANRTTKPHLVRQEIKWKSGSSHFINNMEQHPFDEDDRELKKQRND